MASGSLLIFNLLGGFGEQADVVCVELAAAVCVERLELVLEQRDGHVVHLAHLLKVEDDVLVGSHLAVIILVDDLI